ncbi:MAG: OmpA family protein [Candidatus Margulisiibacteriota bacterium]|nr:MAG: OmpA family protein [Candidatus Margulisiibacteriota bacterium]
MKKLFYHSEETENPFALSIGDLMAALLLIFVLLLASTLLKLQDEFESKSQVAEQYSAIKDNLYKELLIEFKSDLTKWNAVFDKATLAIRFKEPDILFETGKYELKDDFKIILKDFFPRYIKVLTKKQFKDNIEEIRIEGHTDNTGDYFMNMALSQNRTRSVLTYLLNSTPINKESKLWVKINLTANGLSYSKPIADNNTIQGRSLNRRVEFRIRTNAEKQIDEILKYSGKK